MSHENNRRIALAWVAAFNTQDLEALLALYADDAEHYSPKLKARSPGTRGLITGKEAMRAWWQEAFTRLPSLRYEVVDLTIDDRQVFLEYVRRVDGEEDLRVGEMLRITDGMIASSCVYHG
jgi:steroid delta-isomerase-like uncharacterized protein